MNEIRKAGLADRFLSQKSEFGAFSTVPTRRFFASCPSFTAPVRTITAQHFVSQISAETTNQPPGGDHCSNKRRVAIVLTLALGPLTNENGSRVLTLGRDLKAHLVTCFPGEGGLRGGFICAVPQGPRQSALTLHMKLGSSRKTYKGTKDENATISRWPVILITDQNAWSENQEAEDMGVAWFFWSELQTKLQGIWAVVLNLV